MTMLTREIPELGSNPNLLAPGLELFKEASLLSFPLVRELRSGVLI